MQKHIHIAQSLLIIGIFSFLIGLQNIQAQNQFEILRKKLEPNQTIETTQLSPKIIKTYIADETKPEALRKALQNISQIKLLSANVSNPTVANNYWNQLNTSYPTSTYRIYKSIENQTNKQLIFIREKKDKTTELIFAKLSPTTFSVIEIQGNINLKELSALNGIVPADQLEIKPAIISPSISPNKKINPHTPGTYYVFNKHTNQLIHTIHNPQITINGFVYNVKSEEMVRNIDSGCIGEFKLQNTNNILNSGQFDILLEGSQTDPYTVCNGKIYFGQDGYLNCIDMEDECSPKLLINCEIKPLSEIEKIRPSLVRSIKVTQSPRNCSGINDGEFIVVEVM